MTTSLRAYRAVAAFQHRKTGAIIGFYRATILAVLTSGAFSTRADDLTAPADGRLDAIVVTAKRRADAVADETIKRQVEAALRSDPFFYAGHVTVTINNGVVTLQGMVFDDWDLRDALRIGRKVPGVKRVVNDLEIKLGGE